jgi:hypothetical protein
VPDALVMAKALGTSAVVSAAVFWLCAWRWRTPGAFRIEGGQLTGLGAGFFVGCWLLGVWPHFPPREDQDRLLTVVIPSVLVVELVTTAGRLSRWVTWTLRLIVVAGTGRVLLHGTSYLTDFAGPGTRQWSIGQTVVVLGSLGCAQAAVWAALAVLVRRAPGFSHAVCLAGTLAGAGLVIMLSGYATGGQIGLPLAISYLGVAFAAVVPQRLGQGSGPIGVALVGLFSLLVIGHFFGELRTAHAVLLFCAPLLGWLPEISYLRWLPGQLRGVLRVMLVGLLVATIVVHAQLGFSAASRAPEEVGLRNLPLGGLLGSSVLNY